MGGQSVGKDPLITRFLRGVMRLRPRVRFRVPPWDLAVVLEALCKPPFEPIEEVIRASPYLEDGAALSYIFSEESWGSAGPFGGPFLSRLCAGLAKAFLYSRAGYVPKVPSSVPRLVVLQAFCPPPFREPDQEKQLCVQYEHWTHTSTELPCGERRTNC